MNDTIKVITDIWGQIGKLPTAIIIAASVMAFGLVLKKSASFPNKFIPLFVVLACSMSYAILGDAGEINPRQRYPRVILAFYGSLLGFMTWLSHKWFLHRLERILPKGFFPVEEFDTDHFDKPKPKEIETKGKE